MDWTNWRDWLDYELVDNSVLAWATALAVFVVVWIVLGIARRVIRNRVSRIAASREGVVALQIADSAIRQTKGWFLLLLALLVASRFLVWPANVGELITHVLVAALLFQAGFWGTAALTSFLTRRRKFQLLHDPGAVAAMDLLGFALRIVIWAAVVLLILENLEVEVTPLIAGLGVGGIAVALAAQNILGDLFASLSIVLDQPFVVGDFLAVGDFLGSVEKVGLKTTRLRSLSGEQVVLSNADLLSSRIRNYGRMYERRVVFALGVTYQTPAEKLKAIPPMIKEIIQSEKETRFDRAHFKAYGDFSLNFEIVYYVLSREYNVYMDIQQRVNLEIYERFAAQGIEFAYPTQMLYLTKSDGGNGNGNGNGNGLPKLQHAGSVG
jgi:small-conductance mechanosensitive channel